MTQFVHARTTPCCGFGWKCMAGNVCPEPCMRNFHPGDDRSSQSTSKVFRSQNWYQRALCSVYVGANWEAATTLRNNFLWQTMVMACHILPLEKAKKQGNAILCLVWLAITKFSVSMHACDNCCHSNDCHFPLTKYRLLHSSRSLNCFGDLRDAMVITGNIPRVSTAIKRSARVQWLAQTISY